MEALIEPVLEALVEPVLKSLIQTVLKALVEPILKALVEALVKTLIEARGQLARSRTKLRIGQPRIGKVGIRQKTPSVGKSHSRGRCRKRGGVGIGKLMEHVLDGVVHGDLLGKVVIVPHAAYTTNATVGIALLHLPPLSLHHGLLVRQHGAFLAIGLDHLEHAIVTFLFELELDEVVGRGVAGCLGGGIIGGVEVEGGIVVRSGLILLLLGLLLLLLLNRLGL